MSAESHADLLDRICRLERELADAKGEMLRRAADPATVIPWPSPGGFADVVPAWMSPVVAHFGQAAATATGRLESEGG